MKRILFSLGALALALSSCQTSSASHNSAKFPYEEDADRIYFTRNGDNYPKRGLDYGFLEVTRNASLDALEGALREGRGIFLFLHAEDCHACAAAHDDLVSFFLDSGVEVFGAYFNAERTTDALETLRTFSSNHEGLKNLFADGFYTPTIYFIRDETKGYQVGFSSQRTSLENLEEFFKNLMNLPLIYNFRTYDAYASFIADNDCLTCVDECDEAEERGYFYESVFPLAKHSQKVTAHIERNAFSEADKAKLDAILPAASLARIQGGNVVSAMNIEKDPAGSLSFVTEYYA